MYERLRVVATLLDDWVEVLKENRIDINPGTLIGESRRIKDLLAKAKEVTDAP